MAKPIELAVVVVAVLGVGGTFLAGYLLGRGTTPAASQAAASPSADEGDEDEPDRLATKPRPRRTKRVPHADAPPPDAEPTSAPRPPASAAPQEIVVRAAPDADAPALVKLDPDARFVVLETRPGFRRIEAKAADGSVVVGWIVFAEKRPSSWGGVFGGAGTPIHGTTRFIGTPPEMKVPKKRKDAAVCKDQQIPYNAVIVSNGLIADVFVRLADDSVKGDYKAPRKHAEIDQVDCMYTPRIQGVVAGQTIDIKNGDLTLHNVHTYKGVESWFNKVQIKGSPAIEQELPEDPKIIKFTCDVHPWMRAFVITSSHPFFAVSALDGTFKIWGVPTGEHTIEAWHPRHGWKRQRIVVGLSEIEVDFTFHASDPEPPENKDELRDLF